MKNPPTAEDEAIIASVIAEARSELLIAELERRGWERGRTNIGAEAFDTLSRAVEFLPFEFASDGEDEALFA